MGGLSVVRHLRLLLPHVEIVYVGATARGPHGSTPRRTVVSFALDAARFLLQFEPKLVVAACNTASALALDVLTAELPLPVFGVVTPPARAAVRHAAGRTVAVIGTEATIASEAYPRAIHAVAPELEVLTLACPLFVPLVEEGRTCDDPIVRLAVQTYLRPLRGGDVSVVVLGCTHYPLLREARAEYLAPDVNIVGTGRETSSAVRARSRFNRTLRAGRICAATPRRSYPSVVERSIPIPRPTRPVPPGGSDPGAIRVRELNRTPRAISQRIVPTVTLSTGPAGGRT